MHTGWFFDSREMGGLGAAEREVEGASVKGEGEKWEGGEEERRQGEEGDTCIVHTCTYVYMYSICRLRGRVAVTQEEERQKVGRIK